MPQIGGKNAKKKSSSSSTKRHFTVVMGNKEHGLYISSSPSSAARKAVSKLCATDKKRKVEFQIRETTQKSIKKTYGPYLGYIEKLAKPIELKGRVIKYKPVAKLLKKSKTGGAKKRGSILIVEAKDGKVIKKYITKKEADKHMKQRHKRLDKDGIKKKKKKSMRGGGLYQCFTTIPHTKYNFKIENGPSDNKYTLTLEYTESIDNPEPIHNPEPIDIFETRTHLNSQNMLRYEAHIQKYKDFYKEFYRKLSTNNLIKFLDKNKRNMSFILTSSEETNKNIYNINNVLKLLIGYFTRSTHEPINIKDNTDKSDEDMTRDMFLKRIIDRVQR